MGKQHQIKIDEVSRRLNLMANIDRESLNPLYEFFYNEFEAKRKESKAATRAVLTELYELFWSFSDYTSFPRHARDYNPEQYKNPNNLSKNSISKTVKKFQDNKYIFEKYGNKNLPDFKRKAKFQLTEKLKKIFMDFDSKQRAIPVSYSDKERVYYKLKSLLRHAVPEIPPQKTVIVREELDGKKLIVDHPFLYTDEAKDISKKLSMLNEEVYSKLKIKIARKNKYILPDIIEKIKPKAIKHINPSKVNLQAKYVKIDGDKVSGGRLYGHFVHNMPSSLREELAFNVNGYDYSPAYLDFSSIHIAFLYNEERLPIPERDLYALSCFEEEDNSKFRKVIKILYQALLNAKDENGAIYSILKQDSDTMKRLRLSSPELIEEIDYSLLDKIRNGIKEDHKPLSKYLGLGIGIDLQRIDAKIALGVIYRAHMEHSIPVVPIHDGFIFPSLNPEDRNQETSRETILHLMQEEYFRVMGKKSPNIENEFKGKMMADIFYDKYID